MPLSTTKQISITATSDVPESFLSSLIRVRVTSPLSKSRVSHLKFFQVESESDLWLGRVRVESQKLSSHFQSLVCKLESMSSHMKFHIFSITFLCY